MFSGTRYHLVQHHTASTCQAQIQVSSALSRTLNPAAMWVLFGILKEETFLSSMGHICSRESLAGGVSGTKDRVRETLSYRCKASWHTCDPGLPRVDQFSSRTSELLRG